MEFCFWIVLFVRLLTKDNYLEINEIGFESIDRVTFYSVLILATESSKIWLLGYLKRYLVLHSDCLFLPLLSIHLCNLKQKIMIMYNMIPIWIFNTVQQILFLRAKFWIFPSGSPYFGFLFYFCISISYLVYWIDEIRLKQHSHISRVFDNWIQLFHKHIPTYFVRWNNL